MADLVTYEDCDDEEEDIGEEEEATEIHHSIETIVEGLLGRRLDDAPVDCVYSSLEYSNLFSTYHGQLIGAIGSLSHSLRRALHNIPHENSITPTAAHAALKELIISIIRDCRELPQLKITSDGEDYWYNGNTNFIDVDIFSSYESLVASAIINKIVEENQLKFVKDKNTSYHETSKKMFDCDTQTCRKEINTDYIADSDMGDSFSIAELPLECIQIEEVEEITHKYDPDSDEETCNSVSHPSVRMQNIDEVQRYDSKIDFTSSLCNNNGIRIPFPEFDQDLIVDTKTNELSSEAAVASWQENWYFKKKKRLPLRSNIKQQLLTYYDEPSCMLIPCPNESTNIIDDASSELSECHSIKSFELKSGSSEEFHDDVRGTDEIVVLKSHVYNDFNNEELSDKSLLPGSVNVQPSPLLNEDHAFEYNISLNNWKEGTQNKNVTPVIEDNEINETDNLKLPTYKVSNRSDPENIGNLCSHVNDNVNGVGNTAEHVSMIESPKLHGVTAGGIYLIPTHPGSIAEREHKKWLNAVPMKNNPYSAENLSRRHSNPQLHIYSGQTSSYEDFEQTLSDLSCEIKRPLQTKLYCGLRSIDQNRYKRDYYVHGFQNSLESSDCSKSHASFEANNCENFESTPDETLNSLEEKIYVSAGKIFTTENHVKRLERELKDLCFDSTHIPHTQKYSLEKIVKGPIDDHKSMEHNANLTLPSVKILATKFISPAQEEPNIQSECLLGKKEIDVKVKKVRPCIKVHSLTARSLTREFRDRARQNIPKPMNRLFSMSTQANDASLESENACSPINTHTHHTDTTHDYTSDESNASTSSLSQSKTSRHISRSILQRASYWERRVEQGLLSDTSVNENFPGLEESSNL